MWKKGMGEGVSIAGCCISGSLAMAASTLHLGEPLVILGPAANSQSMYAFLKLYDSLPCPFVIGVGSDIVDVALGCWRRWGWENRGSAQRGRLFKKGRNSKVRGHRYLYTSCSFI